MSAESEKRASQRFPKNTPILFTINRPDGHGGDRNERQNATIADISATGMGISTSAHLSTGQFVHFVKDQPRWELPAKGLVVWCIKHGDDFRVGLEFIM